MMLVSIHIIIGLIASFCAHLIFPEISLFYLALMFFSSVLIDFDHYASFVLRKGRVNLKEAFQDYYTFRKNLVIWEKRGIFKRGHFHLFHTLEFHILVFLLGFAWTGFFYIFIGMAFHSICDIVEMNYRKKLYAREFFLVNWIREKI